MIHNQLQPIYNTSISTTPQQGEITYDTSNDKILVYNNNQWNQINQSNIPDMSELQPNEIEVVRKFISNITKYEKVLKEHFPEDYL